MQLVKVNLKVGTPYRWSNCGGRMHPEEKFSVFVLIGH